ncbi:MAG: transglycosylase SLT domain-containing protein [Saprospiraceae bacterium]
MKQSIKCFMFICLLAVSFTMQAQEGNTTYTLDALNQQLEGKEGKKKKAAPVAVTDAELKDRLDKLSYQVPMKFNRLVKAHIKAAIERRRSSTETIIGRSAIYFPIFENALIRHGVPTDLKYLAMVESALNASATSPVGAAGLWQFMRGTGRQYNLRITKYVDERNDPYMSSDAAARYLQDLYERYNDWPLAIAAYNCGPGRVNKAIKKASSSDYWQIIRYLPKETRNYVPAFIAAAYASNYYHLHDLSPEFPEYELQVTEKMRVFKKMTFKEIAKATETDIKTIKFLNPSYKQNFIPSSRNGYLIILPLSKMTAFRDYAPNAKPMYFASSSIGDGEAKLTSIYSSNSPTVKYEQVQTTYRVKRGDNLGKIARKHGVRVRELRKWNKLKSSLLQINQKLIVFETKIVEEAPAAISIDNTSTPSNSSHPLQADIAPKKVKTGKTSQYDVRRGDTLLKISMKYSDISIQDLMQWNNIKNHNDLHPGMQLVIKE